MLPTGEAGGGRVWRKFKAFGGRRRADVSTQPVRVDVDWIAPAFIVEICEALQERGRGSFRGGIVQIAKRRRDRTGVI